MSDLLFEILPKSFLAVSTSWGSFYTFPYRTLPLWTSCTVYFHISAPYTSSAAFLCGALSLFYTAHFLWSLPVRCTFTFPHRTHLPQLSCAVHFHFSAPHTFSAAFLCGALSLFCTAHFLCVFPVRCTCTFSHRTHSPQPSCAVTSSLFTPHTSSAFPCGARFNLIILIPFTEQRGCVDIYRNVQSSDEQDYFQDLKNRKCRLL